MFVCYDKFMKKKSNGKTKMQQRNTASLRMLGRVLVWLQFTVGIGGALISLPSFVSSDGMQQLVGLIIAWFILTAPFLVEGAYRIVPETFRTNELTTFILLMGGVMILQFFTPFLMVGGGALYYPLMVVAGVGVVVGYLGTGVVIMASKREQARR